MGFHNSLPSADADSVCGVGYGVRDPERVNRHIGYRCRELDTQVGTLTVSAADRRHMVSVNDEPPTALQRPSLLGIPATSRGAATILRLIPRRS